MQRRQTKRNSLSTLITAGVPIRSIIDVGVQRDTPDLRLLFPGIPQLLFEPVSDYFPDIHKNYAGMNYHLEQKAVSDQAGEMFLRVIRRNEDGKVSHVVPADSFEMGTRSVQRVTLDGYLVDKSLPQPYLIKIDVDGHETEILEGARNTLQQASCLIVETTLRNLTDRCLLAEAAGLTLWDIVDIIYYHGSLYQADLVFVSKTCIEFPELLDASVRMAREPFDAAAWYVHQSAIVNS